MALGKLGFGLMRLPQNSDDGADINIPLVAEMVDRFLASGFTYFDTSFVYHNGASEKAIREALVKRHPRDSFTLATKFPTFICPREEEVEGIFQIQLENCGVGYFDYYLLHNLNRILYAGVVKQDHLFEHMQAWKAAGQIRHIGFSYHDDAKTLDLILTEHPEVEFVQIALNYYDWEEPFIEAKACYEVIRKHNCQVVVMEPVKGGMLARVPERVQAKLEPGKSPASYAIRYAAGLEGVLSVLSGMSTMEQLEDNISYMMDYQSLTEKEQQLIAFAKAEYMKTWKYRCADWSVLDQGQVPLSGILRAFNSTQIQPNPFFAAELNYYKSFRSAFDRAYETADYSALDAAAGFDVSAALREAIAFETGNSFQTYVPD